MTHYQQKLCLLMIMEEQIEEEQIRADTAVEISDIECHIYFLRWGLVDEMLINNNTASYSELLKEKQVPSPHWILE